MAQRRHRFGDLDLTIADPFERDIQYIYDEIFVGETYHHPNFVLPRQATIVDVGANVGLFSIWAARKYKPRTVLAYEASPTTYACLADNIARYAAGPDTVAHAFNNAVSSVSGETLVLHQPPWNSGLSTLLGGGSLPWVDELRSKGELHEHRIGSTTVSAEIEAHKLATIDLLKIDVEGHFMEVLEGVAREDWAKIRNVALEAEYTETLGHTKQSLADYLRARGFTAEARDGAQVLIYAWR